MRTLIILKGLVKKQKECWVKKEGLSNFLVDISLLKRVYYRPDYKGGGREFLTRSFDDLVYRNFIGALCSHLSTGMLVVVDADQESTTSIEILGEIFGYQVFYHVEPTPIDYIGKNKKYCSPYFISPSKDTLKEQVDSFKRFSTDYPIIGSYQDIENFWRPLTHNIHLEENDRVLHISDLHSHWKVLNNQIPSPEDFALTVFHGDYIDGPEIGGSRRLIDQILKYEGYDNIIFLEGNHELRLRRYLGYIYFRGKQKKIISEVLMSDIPQDFLSKTAKEFTGLTYQDALDMIFLMNDKFKEFVTYSKGREQFACTHAGLRWLDQLCPKYIGNVIYSNKNVERVDQAFSAAYAELGWWSIHGHCRYNELNFNKFPGVINFDTEDEDKVNYLINDNTKNFNVCVLSEK